MRTALAEGFLRRFKDRIHLRIRPLEIGDHPNGLALQRGTAQCRFELYFICSKVEGRRIAFVLALDRIEHNGLIQHAVGNDAGGIERERQRNDAATTDQPQRRSKTHRAGDAGRRPDRAARVRPQREGGKRRRHRGGRTAAGAGSIPLGVPRIQRLAAKRAVAKPAKGRRQFRQVGFAEQNGLPVDQLLDGEGILAWHRRTQHEGTTGGDHTSGVKVVLHHEWNAGQRCVFKSGVFRPFSIPLAGLIDRLFIDGHQCIDVLALVIVRLNVIEVMPDQLFGTQGPGIQCMTHIGETHAVDTVIRLNTCRH
ncbi:hypothetical protein D3C71_1273800 [compost metagenome]